MSDYRQIILFTSPIHASSSFNYQETLSHIWLRGFLSQFLIVLMHVCTVNLTEIAFAIIGHAKASLASKRLQRYIRHSELDFDQLAHFIVR
jgi:hypothetical protein